MKIKIKKFREDARIPTQATHGSAGWDLYSIDTMTLEPGMVKKIPLGIGMEIPDGYYVSIVPRSSLGQNGILLTNSPATIDSDYRGEISCMLLNSDSLPYIINKGNRIAQLILHRYHDMEFEESDDLNGTLRGSGGFGSTGT